MKIKRKEIYTLSNSLSILRLLLFIPIWVLLDKNELDHIRIIILAICLFGALTDILDGLIARKRNEVTEFGKIIDPLADKIVIATLVIRLFAIGEISGYYLFMILTRDLLILIGGTMVTNRIGKVLPSNILGKITVINIAAVLLLILFGINKENIIFQIIYILSIILIAVSLVGYVIRANEFLRRENNESV